MIYMIDMIHMIHDDMKKSCQKEFVDITFYLLILNFDIINLTFFHTLKCHAKVFSLTKIKKTILFVFQNRNFFSSLNIKVVSFAFNIQLY